jgi:hypothetical protein
MSNVPSGSIVPVSRSIERDGVTGRKTHEPTGDTAGGANDTLEVELRGGAVTGAATTGS